MDATTWSFCLPWMFFAALPSELQEEMRNQGFHRPQVATLTTKKLQSKALGQCRDSAVKAYNRLQETKKQMRSMLRVQQNFAPSSVPTNYLSDDDQEPEYEEDTLDTQHQAPVLSYQNRSRAEITMQNAYMKKQKSELLPDGFTPVLKNVNGTNHPCHPADPTRWSPFPVGFRGCFYCGETDHGFSTCPSKSSSDAVSVFHWNLHCHKPELWFKHQERKKSGTRQQKTVQFQPDSNYSNTRTGLGRGRAATTPAWVQRQQANVIKTEDAEEEDAYASGDGYLPQPSNVR